MQIGYVDGAGRPTMASEARTSATVSGPIPARRGSPTASLRRAEANEALLDPERIVIDPDYNSASGRSVRVIGFSMIAEHLITVIVLTDEGVTVGVNA